MKKLYLLFALFSWGLSCIAQDAKGTEEGWPTRFYITKHHGIIRKEILKSEGRQVWNLVRSHLIQ